MKIPRIFHRIWLGHNPLPERFAAYGESWTRLHPDWKMVLWTDENLPKLCNQSVFDACSGFAGRSDLLRYEILRQHGGVYIDTDFECRRNLESLISDVDCFVGEERRLPFDHGVASVANNALIGSVPAHPFLSDLIRSIPENIRRYPRAHVVVQTGPTFFTRVLLRHPEVTVFPSTTFYPYGFDERWRDTESFPDAYAIHHWTLSGTSLSERTRLRTSEVETATVVVQVDQAHGADGLHWTLAGLSCQTLSDHDVIVVSLKNPGVKKVCELYSDRLNLRLVEHLESDLLSTLNECLESARSPRTTFLRGDCVPSPDFVEKHQWGSAEEICYSFSRLYPAEKWFKFRDAVDFGSLWRHSRPEQRNIHVSLGCRSEASVLVNTCFSVPSASALQVGGFSPAPDVRESAVGLTARLISEGCVLIPFVEGARTIRFA